MSNLVMDRSELRVLTVWCGRRDMSWSVGLQVSGKPAMVLTPRDARGPWQSMLLVAGRDEIRLEDESGEMLASASDLPALLDAVEGGVAEAPARRGRFAAGLAAVPMATLLSYVL